MKEEAMKIGVQKGCPDMMVPTPPCATTRIDASNADIYQGGFVGTGGFYVRPISMKKGDTHFGHSHWIDHAGVLLSGSVRIRQHKEDGSDVSVMDVLVPAKIEIKADYWHEIEALEDSEWECWFAAAEADKVYGDSNNVPWFLDKQTEAASV